VSQSGLITPVTLYDANGNTIGSLSRTLYSDPNGDRRTIHNDATITASGSQVLTWVGHSEWYLLINVKNAPTGTSPTIQFRIDEVDPIDQTTTGFGESGGRLGAVLSAAGIDVIEVPELVSDTVKISWTVTGAGASFTGVNVTFCGHGAGNAIEGQAPVGTVLHDAPVPVAGVDDANLIRACKVDADGSLQVIVSNLPAGTSPGSRAGVVILAGGSSGTLNPIRATAYNEQTTNAQRSISSSNANDTSAGTGARTVKITYLDATGAGPFTETVTLNGTTPVNTVATDICYIESIEVLTVGSGNSNAGTITLWTATAGGGTAIGTIGVGTVFGGVGDNRTLWAHHYVATGLVCNVTGFIVGATATSTFHFKAKSLAANSANVIITATIATQAEFQRTFSSPPKIAGPARILGYGVPSTNGVTMNAALDFYDQ